MKRFAHLFIAAPLLWSLPATAFAQEIAPPDEKAEQSQPILPPDDEASVVETEETLDRLFQKLARDPKKASASATARMIWREWSDSGSDSINLLMRWAGSAMSRQDTSAALDMLDQVTVLAPDYAEGWNRRATLHYNMGNFALSLADIESTLALEPRHFGALSGLAVILQRTGKDEAALKTWYKVLEIYPANEQAQASVIELEEELTGRPI